MSRFCFNALHNLFRKQTVFLVCWVGIKVMKVEEESGNGKEQTPEVLGAENKKNESNSDQLTKPLPSAQVGTDGVDQQVNRKLSLLLQQWYANKIRRYWDGISKLVALLYILQWSVAVDKTLLFSLTGIIFPLDLGEPWNYVDIRDILQKCVTETYGRSVW